MNFLTRWNRIFYKTTNKMESRIIITKDRISRSNVSRLKICERVGSVFLLFPAFSPFFLSISSSVNKRFVGQVTVTHLARPSAPMVRATGSVYPERFLSWWSRSNDSPTAVTWRTCDSFLTGDDHDKRANNDAKPTEKSWSVPGSLSSALLSELERKKIT